MNFVEVETALGGARHGQVADVNRIECAAEKRDAPLARLLPGSAVGLRRRDAQRSSSGGASLVRGMRRTRDCRDCALEAASAAIGVVLGDFRRILRLGGAKAVERVGHGAHQLRDAFAGGGRDGVELQAARGAEIAQFFEPRAVGGRVELCGHDDHGLFGEFFAERGQLARR